MTKQDTRKAVEHMDSTSRKDELLEVKDVCELYHVTQRTVYRWRDAGKLKGRKAGHKWLFTREEVEALLK